MEMRFVLYAMDVEYERAIGAIGLSRLRTQLWCYDAMVIESRIFPAHNDITLRVQVADGKRLS